MTKVASNRRRIRTLWSGNMVVSIERCKERIQNIVEEKLDEFDFEPEYEIVVAIAPGWDEYKACTTFTGYEYVITFSPRLIEERGWQEVENVVEHEIVHVRQIEKYDEYGHGESFRTAALELGVEV